MNATRSLKILTLMLLAWPPASNCLAVMPLITINTTHSTNPYYADPTGASDASPAFNNACVSIQNNGGGCLKIPNGTYRFNSQINMSIGNASFAMSIMGESMNGTILRGYNSDGIFKIQRNTEGVENNMQVTVKNLTFAPKITNATTGSGTALIVGLPGQTGVAGGGTPIFRCLTVDNVKIEREAGLPAYAFFKRGIFADKACHPLFVNVAFNGLGGTSWSSNNYRFYADSGIDVTGCWAPQLMDCSVSSAKRGYFYHSSNGLEGGTFYNCNATLVQTGIHFELEGYYQPASVTYKGTFQARDRGVYVASRQFVNVSEATFQEVAGWPQDDVRLEFVHTGTVRDCTFTGNTTTNRNNIYITGYANSDPSGYVINNGDDLILGNNTLGGGNYSITVIEDNGIQPPMNNVGNIVMWP